MGNKTPFISLSVVSLLGRLSSTFFSASQTFLWETCRPIDCYAKTPGRSGFETHWPVSRRFQLLNGLVKLFGSFLSKMGVSNLLKIMQLDYQLENKMVCPFFHKILILKYGFGLVNLPGFSKKNPAGRVNVSCSLAKHFILHETSLGKIMKAEILCCKQGEILVIHQC